MRKSKILSIVSTLVYFIFVAAGATLTISLYVLLNTTDGEEFGEALAAIFIAIVMILALGYTLVAFIPMILRFISIFCTKAFLVITCIVFDVILLLIYSLLLLSIISEGGATPLGIVGIAAMLLVNILSGVLNVFTLKYIIRERDGF